MRRTIGRLGMVVACAACSGGAETAGAGGAGGASSASVSTSASSGSGNPLGEAFSITFDPIVLAPGEEDTKCVVKRVPNAGAIHVGNIRNELSDTSHHLIVYRVDDTEEQLTPFACQPFADLLQPAKGTPLMITQKHDDTLALPKGVGLAFEAGQMIRLEMHYLNATSEPREASATSTFYAMPESDVTAEADLLFIGNPDIQIPPQSQQTLGPSFLRLPAALEGANFFGVTGHTHQFGTKVLVSTAAAKDEGLQSVYDVPNWKWDEPETVYHDPPFQVPASGGFQFSCSWNNTSNQGLSFGESATDEMCFFWAYYYPAKGAFVCVHSDQIPGGIDICCPGSPICSQIFQ